MITPHAAAQRIARLVERRLDPALLEQVLNCLHDPVIVVDKKGIFLLINDAARRVMQAMGVEPDALLGLKREDALRKKTYDILRNDGSPLEPPDLPLGRALRGEEAETEVLFKHRRKPIAFWVHAAGRPLRGDNGELIGAMVVMWDVTRCRRAEDLARRKTDELLRSSEELESFAMSASHELREPLRKARLFLDLARSAATKRFSRAGALLDKAEQSLRRMDSQLEALTAFQKAARAALRRQPVDLGKVVHSVLEQLSAELEEHDAEVAVDRLPIVPGDPEHVFDLFLELVDNALKFRSEERRPRIDIGARRGKNGGVEIFVRDNGLGFDERYVEQIFKPFKRFHRHTEGVGMGLSICQKIADRHGWTLRARARPGKGAEFVLGLGPEEA